MTLNKELAEELLLKLIKPNTTSKLPPSLNHNTPLKTSLFKGVL